MRALPQLQHLEHLELWARYDISEEFLAFPAKSSKLTELVLNLLGGVQVTDAMLRDFINWFRHYPVRVFSCWSWTWTEHDAALKQEFYEAMFNCPTLDTLTLTGCILNDVDTTNLDMKMRVISLEYYSISPDLVDYFKTRVAQASGTV
ncbi:unnamed protein product [Aphanomyces euteiches]